MTAALRRAVNWLAPAARCWGITCGGPAVVGPCRNCSSRSRHCLAVAAPRCRSLLIYCRPLCSCRPDRTTPPYSSGGANGVKMRVCMLSPNLLGRGLSAGGFAVRAVTASGHNVSTSALDFDNVPARRVEAVDKTATVTVSCTAGMPCQVSLGPGQGPDISNRAARKISDQLATLTCGLFQDPARSQPWGVVLATNVPGIGAGCRADLYGLGSNIWQSDAEYRSLLRQRGW